jgi:hemin uptake protein HemP
MAVRRARPEQQLQKAVLDHLRRRAVPCTFAFHPANGGARSPVEARILKSQGVVARVPDIIIVHDGKTYGLELKAAGGRLSLTRHAL